ncbi:PoNe immunity protein domain-containing protein [Cupriavidus alkaliphilus]|uniref:PoNe immunity protein domain-containing protein n=1 Tax=Cupriavidus alkaliphilus TaxID=942866 RepID=UPI00288A3D05|nr:PoNe immunity protein domain-containing protein [Cupriavidus alkaliphilus]
MPHARTFHNFLGYWSFEAAAISIILDIDDAEFRDKPFIRRISQTLGAVQIDSTDVHRCPSHRQT